MPLGHDAGKNISELSRAHGGEDAWPRKRIVAAGIAAAKNQGGTNMMSWDAAEWAKANPVPTRNKGESLEDFDIRETAYVKRRKAAKEAAGGPDIMAKQGSVTDMSSGKMGDLSAQETKSAPLPESSQADVAAAAASARKRRASQEKALE